MDIRVTWVAPLDLLITDEFDVFYKELDQANLNNWVIANPTPLPSTTTFYDITGLKPNTVYKFAVAKSCIGTASNIDELTTVMFECPILGVYQGIQAITVPPALGTYPTLYYSLYYPNSTHVANTTQIAYDATNGNETAFNCTVPGAINRTVYGRTDYITSDVCAGGINVLLYGACAREKVSFYQYNSNLTSAVAYFGLDNSTLANLSFNILCNGTTSDPILFKLPFDYKIAIETQDYAFQAGIIGGGLDSSCANQGNFSVLNDWTPVAIADDPARLSGSLCYDSTTGEVTVSVADGTNQTWLNNYAIRYTTEDSLGNQLLLLSSGGGLITNPNIQYEVYCPIDMSPALSASQLSANMNVTVRVFDPGINVILSLTGVDYTGLTIPQMLTSIAGTITSSTAYQADYIAIGGVDYIRIYTNGDLIVSGEIEIDGPSLLAPTLPELSQTTLGAANRYGVNSAFVYNVGGADFIYGVRGSAFNGALINVTEVNYAVPFTADYSHNINITIGDIELVDEPVPATAYDIQFVDEQYHLIKPAVVDNALLWNDGYTYTAVYNASLANVIKTYDATGTYVPANDLTIPASDSILLLQFDQVTGNLWMFTEDFSGTSTFYVYSNTAVGVWAPLHTGTYDSSNKGYIGTVTGIDDTYTIQAGTTQYSLVLRQTVGGGLPSWTGTANPGLFSAWTVEIINCVANPALNGTTVKLNVYCPSPQCIPPIIANPSNNSLDTIYISPTANPGWVTTLAPGDEIALMYPSTDSAGFYDYNNTWPIDHQGYMIKFDTGSAAQLRTYSLCISSLNNLIRVSQSGFWSGFPKYGDQYRLMKINNGSVAQNPATTDIYLSNKPGIVTIFDSVTYAPTQVTLLDSTSTPLTQGFFQMTFDNTGVMYAILRDVTTTTNLTADIRILANQNSSNDIYKINAAGTALAAIEGAALWNENICGNISFVLETGNRILYFTTRDTREAIRYDIGANTFTAKTIPAVYSKCQSVEQVQGMVYLSPGKFIVLNRLQSNSVTTLWGYYDYTNLFVYDYVNNTVDQALVGANNAAYSGAVGSWNTNSYGVSFGSFNTFNDYGAGGISVTTHSSGFITWKESSFRRVYRSSATVETGVAQIWGYYNAGFPSNARLVRIWNIQNTGTLVESVRTLFWDPSLYGNYNYGPQNLVYSSYYNGLVGATESLNGTYVFTINPINLTGNYGGTNIYSAGNYKPSYISDPTGYQFDIYRSRKITVDPAGNIYLLGADRDNIKACNYQVIPPSAFATPLTVTPTLGGSTGDGVNAGIYQTGSFIGSWDYPHVYISSSNELWTLGTSAPTEITPNPPGPDIITYGPQAIGVFDAATMTLTDTIDLSAINIPVVTDVYKNWNHLELPAFNAVMFYGGTWADNNVVMVDITTKTILYSGTINTILDFTRPSALAAQQIGAIVAYDQGFLVDRNNAGTTAEFWSYVSLTSIVYTGLTHNLLTISANSVNILTSDDVYATTFTADTFGQWKVATALPLPGDDVVYWNNIPGGGNIVINTNETLELTQFSTVNKLIKVENITQSNLYEITDPTYVNATTLPTFNTLNSIQFFAIKADNVNLFNNDVLELTFENPTFPACPFVTTVTINF